MTVPNLEPIDGYLRDVSPAVLTSPYAGNWWMSSTVTRIPETAVGWLVAQGWQVVSTYDEDDVTYYTLTRQSMNSWMILQSLLNAYTFAYNEGRSFNAIRYNDLLWNYNELLNKTRGTLDTIGDVSDGHVSLYLTTIDELWAEVQTETGLCKTDIESAGDAVDEQLALYVSKLNTIEADFDTHAAITRALLVGLGDTEEARINEQFDNALNKARQGLMSRGLYSSVMYAQLEARVERERSEALITLADRLAREKVDNEHKLYMEQFQTQQAVLSGRTQYNQQQLAKGGFLVDMRVKVLMTAVQGLLEKATARMGVRDKEQALMAYQLSTRNDVVAALLNTVERREDTYPDMSSISRLVAGLGDAGSGWTVP